MKKILFLILLSFIALPLLAESININTLKKMNTVKGDMIDFGYLIQPYGIGSKNLSKSAIYCIDVKNKMMVSAEPHLFIKKDELKGERHADMRIIFDEKIIPAGKTRTICLQLSPPKDRLNDGIYKTFGAILLNKTKALGFRIKYEVISAVQDVTVNISGSKGDRSIPMLIVDDKQPLAGFVMDFNILVKNRYNFDETFLTFFEVDNRSTCNLTKAIKDIACPPSLKTSKTDCKETSYELSQNNNNEQCYFLFKKKQNGESRVAIISNIDDITKKPIKEDSIEIKLIAK